MNHKTTTVIQPDLHLWIDTTNSAMARTRNSLDLARDVLQEHYDMLVGAQTEGTATLRLVTGSVSPAISIELRSPWLGRPGTNPRRFVKTALDALLEAFAPRGGEGDQGVILRGIADQLSRPGARTQRHVMVTDAYFILPSAEALDALRGVVDHVEIRLLQDRPEHVRRFAALIENIVPDARIIMDKVPRTDWGRP